MYDFLEYVLSLSPSVLSIPLLGHLNTLDGYGRSITINGTPQWKKINKCYGFSTETNLLGGSYIGSNYQIAHGSEQLNANRTLFVSTEPLIELTLTEGFSYVFSKYDATGLNWLFYIQTVAGPTQQIGLTSTTQTGSIATNYENKTSLAISFGNGVNTKYYTDGSFVGAGGLGVLGAQPTSNIYVGTRYSTGAYPVRKAIKCAIEFPSILSDQQISTIHKLFENIIVGYEPKKIFRFPEQDTKGAVIDLHGEPNQNNIITDKSGFGNHGTVSGNLSIYNDGKDMVWESHGKGLGKINLGKDSSINTLPNTTTIFNGIIPKTVGEAPFGYTFNKGGWYGYLSPVTTMALISPFSIANGAWTFPIGATYNGKQIIIRHDRSNPAISPEVWINGTKVTVSNPVPGNGTQTSDAASNLELFRFTRESDIKLKGFKLFPSLLSDTNVRDEYVEYATKHVHRLTPRFEYPVTFAAKSAPNNVGPWQTWGASHQWLDNGSERYLDFSASGSGYASLQNTGAYGAWYIKIKNEGTGAQDIFAFVATAADEGSSGANNTGYIFYRENVNGDSALFRMNGGSKTFLTSTGSGWYTTNEVYELFITRRITDGQITVYSRDTNHPNWTQAMQTTDNTYQSSKYIQVYHENSAQAIKAYNVIFWPYGDTLLPNDIDFLKD